jgi:TPR repeat protein
MRRWLLMAALLLAMGAALPASADDAADCNRNHIKLARVVAACRRLADQGDAEAQDHLALLYYSGQGVAQDYVQAHMWFNLAAAQGKADAAKHRDDVAAKMTPGQIAQAKALAAAWKPTQ